jgi:hypothetical protein
MKQEEYLAAIKKQQSLIRKLFANRKRRSEVIDELTKERYDHLRGKFFKVPKDDTHFTGAFEGTTFFICGIECCDSHDGSTVGVMLLCRRIFCMYENHQVTNIGIHCQSFHFPHTDNLDDILAPLYISEEKAAEEVSAMYDEFIRNFLKKG